MIEGELLYFVDIHFFGLICVSTFAELGMLDCSSSLTPSYILLANNVFSSFYKSDFLLI